MVLSTLCHSSSIPPFGNGNVHSQPLYAKIIELDFDYSDSQLRDVLGLRSNWTVGQCWKY